ncbi:MAG: PDZ domain-containing protein [Chloroflexi bacterium]|nr:PDZ domain-containing protein [Chloroflexota bacterium]MBU1750574.1 PDZ domain-containing protein [Chloroflexota bacterium]MBU1878953.1 PDZ domain-containing protein [Chloroflexota bacterium]
MRQVTISLALGSIILLSVVGVAGGAWLLSWLPARSQTIDGPYLGLTYVDYNPRIARQCCRPGALVTAVDAGSPADQAGIRPGDVIAVFAGQPLGDGRPLLPLLLACQPGEQVALEVWRTGHARQVEIVLDRRDRQ